MAHTLQTALKNAIASPSKDFQDFIAQYFEDYMYVARGEYDFNLPSKLQREELEVAKKIVANNIFLTNGAQLPTERQLFYLVFKFDLRDLTPFLKNCYDSSTNVEYKISLGLLLYKWGHLKTFVSTCNEVLSDKTDDDLDAKHRIVEITYSPYLEDYTLEKEGSLDLLWIAIQHPNFHLREEAFDTLCMCFRKDIAGLDGLKKMDKILEEREYYISQNVYEDKKLFEERIKSLKEKVKSS